MSTLIPHLIRDSARRLPKHIALEYKDERLTYAELEALMERTAQAVLAAGDLPSVTLCTWKDFYGRDG